MNKKISLILLAITLQTYPIPISFERLILVDAKGKLQKTIDLIGDSHLPVHARVKKPSRGQKHLLIDDEKELFTTGERTLLVALRTLNKRPQKIDLLWEAIPQALVPDKKDRRIPFLFSAGFIAEKEFGTNNTGSLHFINADSYRRTLGPNGIYPEIIAQAIEQTEIIDLNTSQFRTFKLIDLKHDLEKIIAQFSHELVLIQTKYPGIAKQIEKFQHPIRDIWQQYIIAAMIDPALQNNKDATIHELLATLIPEAKQILAYNTITLIPNMEMLFKIINSDARHVILYAGAAHIDYISSFLIEKDPDFDYGYQAEIVIKPLMNAAVEYLFPLSHRTWQFLLESPQSSFQKYKQRQQHPLTFKNTALEKSFYVIAAKINEIEQRMGARNISMEELQQKDVDVKNELIVFFSKEYKTYINFLETLKANTLETLLSTALKNYLSETAQYLIQKGARVNSIDIYGRTPVHYACALPSPTIFMLLVNKGADLDIVDSNGKRPTNYAHPAWSGKVDTLLTKKTQKSQRAYYKKQVSNEMAI